MKRFAIFICIISLSLVSSVYATWSFVNGPQFLSISQNNVNIDAKRLFNIYYNGFSDVNNLPSYAIEDDDIEIKFSEFYYFDSIIMGDEKLILNEDFNVENKTLKINRVTNHLDISAIQPSIDGLVAQTSPQTNTSSSFSGFDAYYRENASIQEFQYDEEGGLLCDDSSTPGVLNNTSELNIKNSFSVNLTIKANPFQDEPGKSFANTVLAFTEGTTSRYLFWLGFFEGFMHIYAYRSGPVQKCRVDKYTEDGFICLDASIYKDKKINIQVIATKNDGKADTLDDNAELYINGEYIISFNTGKTVSNFNQVTLGDLRPDRNLRFTGTIYDIGLYNKRLSQEEIQTNWEYANELWSII